MGLLDFFRAKALTASPAVVEAARSGQLNLLQRRGGTNAEIQASWMLMQAANYAYLYSTQPSVRKVVDYIASNAGSLPLKLYERVSDTDRRRDTDHPAAQTMYHPNSLGPADDFLRGVFSDYLVYDNAYALKFRGANGGPRILIRIPPPAIGVNATAAFLVDSYRIWRSDGTYIDVAPEDVIHWHGYNPDDARIGLSRLETLRQILAEEAATQQANVELMKGGLKEPGLIMRPIEAPEWSEEARKRFQRSMANQSKAASREYPVLEEGMTFAKFGLSPKDAEMLEGRRFTNEEVASLYGLKNVPPESEEERKQFYSDVLPPLTEDLACQLKYGLLEQEYSADDYYFEFEMNAKLAGDPVARFSAITSATGRPWMTVDEARALENLPSVDTGDELTIPLNVMIGDNPRPAPNVMPPQNPLGPPQGGEYREAALPPATKLLDPRHVAAEGRRNGYASALLTTLERFYTRQENAVTSKGVKAPFDNRRWDKELADDLEPELARMVEREGDVQARRFGGLAFDSRQTTNYLRSTAEDVARQANAVTAAELREASAADTFERARAQRAPTLSMDLATAMATFATLEAAKQSPDTERREKTWIVTSSNSEHPEMDGETVPLGATFSNGSAGPPADHPGCQCLLDIT